MATKSKSQTLRHYTQMVAEQSCGVENARLRAENARLREALESISYMSKPHIEMCAVHVSIARAALAEGKS